MKIKILKGTVAVIAIAVLVLCGAFYATNKILNDKMKPQPVTIDRTPMVVKSIRDLNQLVSAKYQADVRIKDTKVNRWTDNGICKHIAHAFGSSDSAMVRDNIVLIVNDGQVNAGFDLSCVTDKDVHISGDTVRLTLPKAIIMEATINPSNYRIFIEDGNWSEAQVSAVKSKAIDELKSNAIAKGILQQATDNGIDEITRVCKTLGFKEVICNVSA